jgi:uncharacterized membrane protein
MSQKRDSRRIWEIDFLRGLSIILVVGYHLLYDLGAFVGIERFFGFTTNLSTLAWSIAQHFFAGLFIVLCGTSSTLTRSNTRRGLKLLAVSIIVTAITYIFDPPSAIWFGILQLLAVSILVFGAAFEKAKPVTCAAWGVIVLALIPVLRLLKSSLTIRFNWLLPLGIHSPGYSSFDYFPLIPWFGIFLIGAALGRSVYAPRRSLLPWRLPQTFVNAAGRHSLLIYIVHQPVILAVLYVLGLMK